MCLQIIHLIYIYKLDLALNNQQWLRRHETQPNEQFKKKTQNGWTAVKYIKHKAVSQKVLSDFGFSTSDPSNWLSSSVLIRPRSAYNETVTPNAVLNFEKRKKYFNIFKSFKIF